MNDQRNNNNSGLLFPAPSMKVVRQGKVDIEGSEHSLIIVKCQTGTGKTVYEIHQQVGVMFEAEPEKDFDSQGTIDVGSGKLTIWGRRKTSNNNTPMTAVSMARPQQQKETSNAPVENAAVILDDDIPF